MVEFSHALVKRNSPRTHRNAKNLDDSSPLPNIIANHSVGAISRSLIAPQITEYEPGLDGLQEFGDSLAPTIPYGCPSHLFSGSWLFHVVFLGTF